MFLFFLSICYRRVKQNAGKRTREKEKADTTRGNKDEGRSFCMKIWDTKGKEIGFQNISSVRI